MKRFLSIVVLGVLLLGCSTEENVVDDQKISIRKYLEGKSLAYEELSGVFRHVYNADREDYEQAQRVAYGDVVEINFAIHKFGSPFGALYYSNVRLPEIEKDTVLNTEYWDFNPLRARLGSTKLIRGLEYGLVGSREGDSLWLFLTSDVMYGGNDNGIIPGNEATAWAVKINKVERNE